jgi:hypothetical protein
LGRAAVEDAGEIQGQKPTATATRVTRFPMLRFAVGAFDTWPDAQKAAQVLRCGQKPLSQISYLGLREVLIGGPAQPLCDLSFPGNAAQIACSTGPIAERLAARLTRGAPSLQAALVAWLIPRHAAQLQRSVEKGKIVAWVELSDHEAERRAYRALHAAGSDSVGVHDLVGP